MSSEAKPRESRRNRLLRLLVFVALYSVVWVVTETVTRAIPEIRAILLVLGLLSIPVLVWMVWRRDYDQPPRRGI
jgi:antibiotic biosynthesis monooxygenase (ABM) superfamily enzyme